MTCTHKWVSEVCLVMHCMLQLSSIRISSLQGAVSVRMSCYLLVRRTSPLIWASSQHAAGCCPVLEGNAKAEASCKHDIATVQLGRCCAWEASLQPANTSKQAGASAQLCPPPHNRLTLGPGSPSQSPWQSSFRAEHHWQLGGCALLALLNQDFCLCLADGKSPWPD